MGPITLPPPDEIRQRIADCEAGLKALRRLLRASQDAYDAKEARERRTEAVKRPEVAHAKAAQPPETLLVDVRVGELASPADGSCRPIRTLARALLALAREDLAVAESKAGAPPKHIVEAGRADDLLGLAQGELLDAAEAEGDAEDVLPEDEGGEQ